MNDNLIVLTSKADAEAGYWYDYYRQFGKSKREEIKKSIRLKKRIDKLSKKNRSIRPKR